MDERTVQTQSGPGEGSSLCSFVSSPFPDCYCNNMTGRKIMKVVSFCAGDFSACPIYRENEGAERERTEPLPCPCPSPERGEAITE